MELTKLWEIAYVDKEMIIVIEFRIEKPRQKNTS